METIVTEIIKTTKDSDTPFYTEKMISAMIKRKGGMAMIYTEQEMEHSGAMQTAARMCTAARTAPKTRHIDGIHTLVVTGEEKEELAQKMEEFGKAHFKDDWQHWYGRDAQNVRVADAVVLVGVEKSYRGLQHCDFCDFGDCHNCKTSGGNCAYIYVVLGIAISSAAIIVQQDLVDTRIYASIGKAASEMPYGQDYKWLGIALSVSGKNPFFDR